MGRTLCGDGSVVASYVIRMAKHCEANYSVPSAVFCSFPLHVSPLAATACPMVRKAVTSEARSAVLTLFDDDNNNMRMFQHLELDAFCMLKSHTFPFRKAENQMGQRTSS